MSGAARDETISQPSSLAAFSAPAFRWYFGGQLISVSGTWMQTVAQQVVVYNMTQSELALGLVALAQGLPSLILTPFAGVIIEHFPRRQILVFTQTFMMALAFILAALQFANVLQVWHIMVLSVGLGLANALDAPARQAFVVEMVGHEQLSSGIMMNSIMFNSARVVGPALGGLALATVGSAWCFFLNGASFVAVIAGLIVMQVPAIRRPSGSIAIMKPLLEGIQFARDHSAIRPLLLLSAVTSTFGITFAVLIPAFAGQVLHDTSGGTAALTTAQGIGAVAAGIAATQITRFAVRGKFVTTFMLVAPLTVIGLAVSTSYWSALPFIMLAGFFLIGQFILMNTLIQTHVPDEFRGRVSSLYTLTFFGFSPISSLVLGLLGQIIGTVAAILLWGAICLLLTMLVLIKNPQLPSLR